MDAKATSRRPLRSEEKPNTYAYRWSGERYAAILRNTARLHLLLLLSRHSQELLNVPPFDWICGHKDLVRGLVL
jgi:hypothetical protein